MIECPLHAASFDLRTGKPTGPPAKRPVRTYPVLVEDGVVYVDAPSRASVPAPTPAARRRRPRRGPDATGRGMTRRTIAIVGASLSGLRAAQQLRAQGYDDGLVIVGAEPHLPYDRPPLSKEYLLGTMRGRRPGARRRSRTSTSSTRGGTWVSRRAARRHRWPDRPRLGRGDRGRRGRHRHRRCAPPPTGRRGTARGARPAQPGRRGRAPGRADRRRPARRGHRSRVHRGGSRRHVPRPRPGRDDRRGHAGTPVGRARAGAGRGVRRTARHQRRSPAHRHDGRGLADDRRRSGPTPRDRPGAQ